MGQCSPHFCAALKSHQEPAGANKRLEWDMEMLIMHQPLGKGEAQQLKDLRFWLFFWWLFFVFSGLIFFVAFFCLFNLYLLEPMSGFWGHAGPLMFKPQGSARDSVFVAAEFWLWTFAGIKVPSVRLEHSQHLGRWDLQLTHSRAIKLSDFGTSFCLSFF